jgi:hypothetical protein
MIDHGCQIPMHLFSKRFYKSLVIVSKLHSSAILNPIPTLNTMAPFTAKLPLDKLPLAMRKDRE